MSEVKNCIASCSPAAGARLLDRVYATWASIAEVELQGITGSDIRLGHKAKKPILVRKSFRNQGPSLQWDAKGNSISLAWLKGRALELERIIASPGLNGPAKVKVLDSIDHKSTCMAERGP
eukprot:9997773-Heterocapsa_arctica.AAC.1